MEIEIHHYIGQMSEWCFGVPDFSRGRLDFIHDLLTQVTTSLLTLLAQACLHMLTQFVNLHKLPATRLCYSLVLRALHKSR